MKKTIFVWTIVLAVVVVAVTVTTASLAIWQRNDHNNTYIKTAITDENPSLKYQMYVPVKASGSGSTTTTSAYARVPGTFAVNGEHYSYTLDDASELSNITGFSLAGWFGGVSLEYLDIPLEVTVTVNGIDITKPVVRVNIEADYGDYGFGGVNTAIKTIVVAGNVSEITTGAFYGMAYLETVTLEEGETPVYLYPYCFGGCVNLKSIEDRRISPNGWSTALITAGSFAIQ